MEDITSLVSEAPGSYEFYWREATSALGIFLKEDLVRLIPLERNGRGTAVEAGKAFLAKEKANGVVK